MGIGCILLYELGKYLINPKDFKFLPSFTAEGVQVGVLILGSMSHGIQEVSRDLGGNKTTISSALTLTASMFFSYKDRQQPTTVIAVFDMIIEIRCFYLTSQLLQFSKYHLRSSLLFKNYGSCNYP